MRYVVFGAGAVGGTIAGRLAQHGQAVSVIARGPHLDAIRRDGLHLADPDGSHRARIDAHDRPGDVSWRDDDVVILSMKTQDTAAALRDLADAAPPTISVVCAQNGVENERLAARLFADTYGICVMLPATHLEPGVVVASSAPVSGILDVGRFPAGADATAEQIAADLGASAFDSEAQPAIMRWKYAKLLTNLGNALEAAAGPVARGSDLAARARAEGEAVLDAAGIDYASQDEDRRRRGDILRLRPVDGQRRGGGSSWQSLARGAGSIESDYLNGEIVLLGRLHGVRTPVNALLQHTANELARTGAPPGSVPIEQLEDALRV